MTVFKSLDAVTTNIVGDVLEFSTPNDSYVALIETVGTVTVQIDVEGSLDGTNWFPFGSVGNPFNTFIGFMVIGPPGLSIKPPVLFLRAKTSLYSGTGTVTLTFVAKDSVSVNVTVS